MIPENNNSKPEIMVFLTSTDPVKLTSHGIVTSRRKELTKRLAEANVSCTVAPNSNPPRGVPRSNSCSKIFLRGVRMIDVVEPDLQEKRQKLKKTYSEPALLNKMATSSRRNPLNRGTSSRLVTARMNCRRKELENWIYHSRSTADTYSKASTQATSPALGKIPAEIAVVVDVAPVVTSDTGMAKLNKAATTIQNFFRDTMELLDGIKYWDAEREDVERRRQEDLADIRNQLELEKQKLRIQFSLDEVTDEEPKTLDFPYWSQGVDQVQGKTKVLKDEAEWLRRSMNELICDNKKLEKDCLRKEKAAMCLEEKIQVLETEQEKLQACMESLEKERKDILAAHKSGLTTLSFDDIAAEAKAQLESWQSILSLCEKAQDDIKNARDNMENVNDRKVDVSPSVPTCPPPVPSCANTITKEQAARRIQRFFIQVQAAMAYHKQEIRYWQKEKEAIRLRQEQELMNIQRRLEIQKHILLVEASKDSFEQHPDAPKVDWDMYCRWARGQIKDIEKEADDQAKFGRAVRLLKHKNKQLASGTSQYHNRRLLLELEQAQCRIDQKLECTQDKMEKEQQLKQLCKEYTSNIVETVNSRSDDPTLFNALGKITQGQAISTPKTTTRSPIRTRSVRSLRLKSQSLRSLSDGIKKRSKSNLNRSRSSSRTKALTRNGSVPNLNGRNDASFYSWQTHLQRVNSEPLLTGALAAVVQENKPQQTLRKQLSRKDSKKSVVSAPENGKSRKSVRKQLSRKDSKKSVVSAPELGKRRKSRRNALSRNDSESVLSAGKAIEKSRARRQELKRNVSDPVL